MKRNNFKKILVIGCPGSGKSTLSRRLKSKLSLPLIHLDKYYHKPNWKEPYQSEWNITLLNLMGQNSWKKDGKYAESDSYTHLRAHETYRNVLCRLLL